MSSFIWFATNILIQTANLIRCFPVIITLSYFTSWSFGPCCAVCLPALGNSSHTPLHTQTTVMPALPWEQPGDHGEQSGCCTLWLTPHTFMCWTKLSILEAASCMPKNTKKCVNNTDSEFITRLKSSSNSSNKTKRRNNECI